MSNKKRDPPFSIVLILAFGLVHEGRAMSNLVISFLKKNLLIPTCIHTHR
ncbi:hypothetical protein KKB18_10275 [bacterium]|nr:hypothetical protein [bacterium]